MENNTDVIIEANTCVICHDTVKDRLNTGVCDHTSCYECLREWVRTSGRQSTGIHKLCAFECRTPLLYSARCPYCRKEFMFTGKAYLRKVSKVINCLYLITYVLVVWELLNGFGVACSLRHTYRKWACALPFFLLCGRQAALFYGNVRFYRSYKILFEGCCGRDILVYILFMFSIWANVILHEVAPAEEILLPLLLFLNTFCVLYVISVLIRLYNNYNNFTSGSSWFFQYLEIASSVV